MKNWVKVKDSKVVVKLRNEDGSFKKSIIIPTSMYPLNSSNIKFFDSSNTIKLEDKKILKIINSIDYKIGQCYSNTRKVIDVLEKDGYKIKSYVGWLFSHPTQFPVHHCWAVINDNAIIDLSDDFTKMNYFFEENKTLTGNISSRELIISFKENSKKMENSTRCYPMGLVSDVDFARLVYIGAECSPEQGLNIYENFKREYPNHECYINTNKSGMNLTFQMLKDNGLL